MSPLATLDAGRARQIAEQVARRLARKPRIRLVYLYGSAVRPGASRVRDVDLAVSADPPFDLDELLRLRADLLTESRAPLELISLDDASIVLAHEVADSGVCLHAAPPEAETEFVVRARARYWDFKPYLEEQWRLAGERLEARLGEGD